MRRVAFGGLFWAGVCVWSITVVLWAGFVVASDKEAVLSPVNDTTPGQWREVKSGQPIQSKRAPVRHVGAVMAILGTLNEAGVLPLESDPRANQLIRSLIQFQSVFMKSQEPAVHEYFSSALVARWGAEGAAILNLFYKQGWSSESLEAVVEYSRQYPMWEDPRIEAVFHAYNLSPADWALIEQLFLEARQRFESQNQDLHVVFARQRQSMPGGGSSRTH